MRNLMFSTVPALVVAVVLLGFRPVFSAGQNGAGIDEPTAGQTVSCHQLDLAIGTPTADINEATIIRCYLADFGGPFYIVHALSQASFPNALWMMTYHSGSKTQSAAYIQNQKPAFVC
jgi:hypothetical protein